jgi:signal recognition particle subunit SRP72
MFFLNQAPAAAAKGRHKRKRKLKLPKNFDKNAVPDPERWLPKWERSTYKKRKDKRQREKEIGRGTQGAVDPSLEVNLQKQPNANETTTPGSPKAPPAAAAGAAGPRQQKAASSTQAKQKKKKGRGK